MSVPSDFIADNRYDRRECEDCEAYGHVDARDRCNDRDGYDGDRRGQQPHVERIELLNKVVVEPVDEDQKHTDGNRDGEYGRKRTDMGLVLEKVRCEVQLRAGGDAANTAGTTSRGEQKANMIGWTRRGAFGRARSALRVRPAFGTRLR
jgi:hypothetical protein